MLLCKPLYFKGLESRNHPKIPALLSLRPETLLG